MFPLITTLEKMNIFLSQYGKAVLYIFIAISIIIPVLFLSLTNNMKDLTYDQSTRENRDNSYLLEYEAPEIILNKPIIKVAQGTNTDNLDIKGLFGAKATIDSGKTELDSMYINYSTDLETSDCGIYNIAFTCTYTYTTADGVEIPRESIHYAKIVVE